MDITPGVAPGLSFSNVSTPDGNLKTLNYPKHKATTTGWGHHRELNHVSSWCFESSHAFKVFRRRLSVHTPIDVGSMAPHPQADVTNPVGYVQCISSIHRAGRKNILWQWPLRIDYHGYHLVIEHMGLSENRGYPQIAILMGNMVIIHWNMRYTIFRQTHMGNNH